MITTLYKPFQQWSAKGSIYLISDTHFEDKDCLLMDENWPSPEAYVANCRFISKNDTLIHLGDVGNPEWMKHIKGYKVLITGNHDEGASKYTPYFHEIFTGPLMIAPKLILSHEPITILADITGCPVAFNIHGHDHNRQQKPDIYHYNIASNVIGYRPVNLKDIIKQGLLSDKRINDIHREIIDNATANKNA